jgi:hypothetical protein
MEDDVDAVSSEKENGKGRATQNAKGANPMTANNDEQPAHEPSPAMERMCILQSSVCFAARREAHVSSRFQNLRALLSFGGCGVLNDLGQALLCTV